MLASMIVDKSLSVAPPVYYDWRMFDRLLGRDVRQPATSVSRTASEPASGALDWLREYEVSGFVKVEGWTGLNALRLLAAVAKSQNQLGATGGVMEIGIFHGKFFIALNGVNNADMSALAIDIFGDQHLNIDGSGNGDEERFRSNLAAHDRHKGTNVVVMRADSTTLSSEQIFAAVSTRPRIISIDGGHTVEHTLSDLKLAASVLDPKGVIFLDDIVSPGWLGVMEAAVTYLQGKPTVWPVAIVSNKLLFCGMSLHERYRRLLQDAGDVKFEKTTKLCGYDVLEGPW